MSNSKIDCVKAIQLQNQSAELTTNETALLQSHLDNCLECRELQISCTEALAIIDYRSVGDALTKDSIALHTSRCPECRAASILEPSLRKAIAPAILPTPSSNFEAMLAAKLVLTPVSAKSPLVTVQVNRNDRVSQWSWAVASITFAAVLASQFPKAYTVVTSTKDLSLSAMAFVASHLTGEVAVAYSIVKHFGNYFRHQDMNIYMVVALLIVTLTTSSRFILRDD